MLAFIVRLAALAAVSCIAFAATTAPESDWPLTLRSGDTQLTVYPLQLDRWDGGTLSGRAAVRADVGKDKPKTSYGVVRIEARALTDKRTRLVTLDQPRIERAEFPALDAATGKRYAAIIAGDLARRSRTIALDRLEASLAIAGEGRQSAGAALGNDPPQILFSESAAILVSIDGDPVFREVKGTGLQRIINTRPLVLRDAGGHLYVHVFDGWLGAGALAGPWTVAAETPGLAAALKEAVDGSQADPLNGRTAPGQPAPSLRQVTPAIIVATKPTELVVFDGPPRYVPIAGTTLQFADNTTGNVFTDSADHRTYVLVAGRWFRAADTRGPWSYVAANALPAGFAQIPDDSPKENVKASVAGTEQAREAAIAATVPQTALVKVAGTAIRKPVIDGDPVLKPLPPTKLQYVSNSATPILWSGGADYYALQNGVWFHGPSVLGPWAVATSVPAEIYAIPPTSPLYHVTFVHIYNVRDGVVYVGYSPGYGGSYVDPVSGVVVYGTGYAYDPWIGSAWYGWPPTYGWGAAVAYTPWAGWAVAFGLGWAWGAATSYWGWGPYPYWGPWYGAAYGPRGGAVAWGPGGWAGASGNIYTQWGNRATVSRVGGGFDAWTGNAWASRVGVSYNSRTGIASAGQRGAVENVYTGNYAAGGRGIAAGPGGGAVAGGRVTIGNAGTGRQATVNRGAAYNPATGQVTTFGGIRGNQGAAGHIGDDVYAAHDGNVYRHDESGWQQHSAGGGWQPVAGSAQGEATRSATGGLGAAGPTHQLDREHMARHVGAARSMPMHRSFGGGGRMGGFRRR